jgi:hypothetical protein
MEWLEPWSSTENYAAQFHESFRKQLEREVAPGHVMHGVPVKLIACGNGDDALFQILDGSGRVAEVHLTWSKEQERLPWPGTTIYASLEEWAQKSMCPAHEDRERG